MLKTYHGSCHCGAGSTDARGDTLRRVNELSRPM